MALGPADEQGSDQEPGSWASSGGIKALGSGEPSAGAWNSPVRCKAMRHKGLYERVDRKMQDPRFQKGDGLNFKWAFTDKNKILFVCIL